MSFSLSRRGFLRVGTASALGLSLPDVLRAESRGTRKSKADGLILVWLGGGPATIDMWDLKPDAPEEFRGEFKPIDTAAQGVRVCEHLPKVAGVMKKCALVRSLHHSITDHGAGAAHLATGHPPAAALKHPSLGAIAAKLLPAQAGLPPYIALDGAAGFPGAAGFLGADCDPFTVDVGGRGGNRAESRVEGISLSTGFTADRLADRNKLRGAFDTKFHALERTELPGALDSFQQQATDILGSDRVRKAFDLSLEKDAVREPFGPTVFGRSALTARRLIEAGARCVTVGLTGWDTHAGSFRTMRQQLLPELDRVLSALVTDLSDHGMLDRTVVYCVGEFGRTPRVNGSAGRDHWARSMSVLLAGGGVRGGTAYGSTDAHGLAPENDPCSPADVSATVMNLLGIDPAHELRTLSGRPVAAFRDGKVIESLIG
ncbi:protein containing duf1501 : Uncharacterized protein OS=Planctomyces brasiliensis (strain ATCC 49424 / DSM 5305 / JCM 21570 / NBRC 103401 / IFAM 1448) GN=Plabr_3235 PE=4 SV=1: DUF1501 [Gemmata massiliana]|uniref:DUF1501 domain-containing protein n=1 Tax=Gemmata massiliana TaxID=1210884 RepID=A0A6P2CXC5_9BACT|nr:DUF1501 domain-containing protein [Gemmata massiliana]VTR93553.1 protein containing duf1501 : Uncharacterized protein OS=Planctomyces brasiliensis (strain ATCC 49424 / DSM 5305 / JCM 21570 / NBRC 103401 / IFAM 1448) GN=Plabr_3235 PE=4 SV=1: DUF1501 [Gemmata massiliana]